MATLAQTLSGAPASKPKYSYSYMPPSIQSPYPRYPTNQRREGVTTGADTGLYSALLSKTMGEAQRIVPSTQFAQPMSFDPVLSRINAMSAMTLANARAEAQALRKRAVIESGAEDVGTELGLDPNTLEATRQNPFSGAKILQRDYDNRLTELDQALNTGNLFFSGERVRKLADTERGRAEAQTNFTTGLRDALAGIQNQLLAAEERDRQERLAAELADLFRKGLVWPSPGGSSPAPSPAGLIYPEGHEGEAGRGILPGPVPEGLGFVPVAAPPPLPMPPPDVIDRILGRY